MDTLASPRLSSTNDVLPSAYRGVRPADPPRGHASGPAPYRVLAVGGRILVGYGVLTHELAMTGAIARGLAALVGHGCDVESMITERSTIESVAEALRAVDLAKVDALVLVLDQEGDPRRIDETARQLHALVAELSARMVPGTGITLVVPPTTMMRRSEASLSRQSSAAKRFARPDSHSAGSISRSAWKLPKPLKARLLGAKRSRMRCSTLPAKR